MFGIRDKKTKKFLSVRIVPSNYNKDNPDDPYVMEMYAFSEEGSNVWAVRDQKDAEQTLNWRTDGMECDFDYPIWPPYLRSEDHEVIELVPNDRD